MSTASLLSAEELSRLQAVGLGELAERLMGLTAQLAAERAKNEKLTFEIAQLRKLKYGVKSEQLNAEQRALFEEAIDADIADIEEQLDEMRQAATQQRDPSERPKRAALPASLPRVERHHEPDNTTCACGCELKRIGEDISEKLDYTPGVFTVERHIRGKWACGQWRCAGRGRWCGKEYCRIGQ